MASISSRRCWALAGVVLLALGAGCNDEHGRFQPDLDDLWPNADGKAWTYDLRMSARDDPGLTVYATPQEVPPLPSWAELASMLEAVPQGAPADSGTGVMRLRFDGQITTEGGATAQHLTEEYYDPVGDGLARRAAGPASPFLRALARARPDLAAKLRVPPSGPEWRAAASYFDEPLFLYGYAWEKTSEHIASYGDLNDEISWLYLVSDLDPGDTFAMQLVPDLADNVTLRGQIRERRDVSVETGTYDECVECLYVVDYGVTNLVNEDGGSLGYCRPLSVGIIVYVADVGPVYSRERHWLPGNPLLGNEDPRRDNEASLIGFGGD